MEILLTLLSRVGDTVCFTGTFPCNIHSGNNITSQDLAGGTPTKHNIVDPESVLEVDGQGNPTSDQYLILVRPLLFQVTSKC